MKHRLMYVDIIEASLLKQLNADVHETLGFKFFMTYKNI